ncbi:bZIP transcription factor [Paludisphaera soli]|uniref:bZIP transcription factor n=1 Tax=Paludisphaera soli TaxID=2712865 RepID=UPI0013ED7DB4|nr:bZIP transcription factor [Paludisphaera soli]
MNESLAVCPHCAARLRLSAEPGDGPTTCARCRRTFRSPSATTASGSSSGEYATADPPPPDGAHVEVACPDCGAGLRVREKYVGRHVRCGGCRAKFLVQTGPTSAPVASPPGLAQPPAATPDPDDPWQGRAEVLRLLDEVATLRAENAGLRARVERLERERDAAGREAARARSTSGRYAPRDDDDDAVTFRFLDEAARASGA